MKIRVETQVGKFQTKLDIAPAKIFQTSKDLRNFLTLPGISVHQN
jgi:hypothetical protein